MVSKLNLKDAFTRIERAKELHQELDKIWRAWRDSEGVALVVHQDPELAKYVWAVVMEREPEKNLGMLAGEIFNHLRSALDYVAFEIYMAGGGDRTAPKAKSVAFPIVTDEERWAKTVKANVRVCCTIR